MPIWLFVNCLFVGVCLAGLAFLALLLRLFPPISSVLTFKQGLKRLRWTFILPPLLAAVSAWVTYGNARFSDIADRASRSPTFTVRGELHIGGLRRRFANIRVDGRDHGVICDFSNKVSCLWAVHPPRMVLLKAFDYDGAWVVLEVRSLNGVVLRSEADRKQSLAEYAHYVASDSPLGSAAHGFLFGVEFVLFVIGVGWIAIRSAKALPNKSGH